MPFNLLRKFFLSHTGRDKEFVRHLHKALCNSYPGAFFDEEIIPKSGALSMENDKVVKQMTRIIGPAIPLSRVVVIHGKDRLCQMVDDMYKEAASKCFLSVQNMSNTQAAFTSASNLGLEEDYCYVISYVVGIHGFTVLGKTTLCKWLCDFYHQELSGRVCYIDVGSMQAATCAKYIPSTQQC